MLRSTETKATQRKAFPNHRNYRIDDLTACVPREAPLTELPASFKDWDSLAARLSCKNDEEVRAFRAAVDAMPPLDHTTLTEIREIQRGFMLIAHIAQTYVFGMPGSQPLQELPEQVAQPYVALAERLGCRPVMAVAPYAFYNWRVDETRPWWSESRNITFPALQICHTLTPTEQLFGSISVLSESIAGPLYPHITRALETVDKDGDDAQFIVRECLEGVLQSIRDIMEATQEIWKGCDPATFFRQVRTFLSGWSDPQLFPNGLLFRGVTTFTESPDPIDPYALSTATVTNQPNDPVVHKALAGDPGIRLKFAGASAAQNPSVAACDLFLGVHHRGQVGDSLSSNGKHHNLLAEVRNHMEGPHRRYLNDLARHGGLRPWLTRKLEESPDQPGVREMGVAYNACVEDLTAFRSKHLAIATQFVVLEAKKALREKAAMTGTPEGEGSEEAKGSGGSSVVPFLKQARSETSETKVVTSPR
ncbi:Indoleamine 2,3-dioxygenase [Gonapodya prolifera JEL478]|uniref:Indoleamine 2,3-dioxygenase n=1 Tax=Gonapodya prolifera (strain JEL478) TaxID=1344416 RepID=A0A139AA14_GONPJ|nr:Indoleamine 2,3-dioxygenase [Gonapodya prolifera JEL478]|eukprot:KXS13494.1 Indoleamine 2,3-dioxygenase [Gonapodya prolifera JEL478]